MLAREGAGGCRTFPGETKRPLPPSPHLPSSQETLESLLCVQKWGFVPLGSQSGRGDIG